MGVRKKQLSYFVYNERSRYGLDPEVPPKSAWRCDTGRSRARRTGTGCSPRTFLHVKTAKNITLTLQCHRSREKPWVHSRNPSRLPFVRYKPNACVVWEPSERFLFLIEKLHRALEAHAPRFAYWSRKGGEMDGFGI
jgi:hypothetical protein